MPEVSKTYESNVKGLYIVGSLGGYPLIKHAINQGYEVIEYINGNTELDPADEPIITKTLKASDELSINDIVVSGGVSANKKLRERFDKEKGIKNIYFPDLAYSTDNGAMIAYMGWLKFSNQNVNSLEINPKPTSSLI